MRIIEQFFFKIDFNSVTNSLLFYIPYRAVGKTLPTAVLGTEYRQNFLHNYYHDLLALCISRKLAGRGEIFVFFAYILPVKLKNYPNLGGVKIETIWQFALVDSITLCTFDHATLTRPTGKHAACVDLGPYVAWQTELLISIHARSP